jgi:hypothetical protein
LFTQTHFRTKVSLIIGAKSLSIKRRSLKPRNTGLPWHSLTDTQQVRPWMLGHPVHGADGRLANAHGSPYIFRCKLLALLTL